MRCVCSAHGIRCTRAYARNPLHLDVSCCFPDPRPATPATPAGMGSPDLFHANLIAREMIMSMGMGRRTGPIDLLRVAATSEAASGADTLRAGPAAADGDPFYYHTTDMSTEQVCVQAGGGGGGRTCRIVEGDVDGGAAKLG